jgi:hypothetical protein
MTAFRLLTATLIVGLTLSAAHAAGGDALDRESPSVSVPKQTPGVTFGERNAIASGAKLTKADAARTAPQPPAAQLDPGSQAQRGIEKKDIRRGMVIAKPGSITPHTKTTPLECPPDCVAPSAAPVTTPRD